MIKKLQRKLSLVGRTKLIAHVRETNLPGQLFLRDVFQPEEDGFRWTETLRRHFSDTNEDSYCMEYEMPMSRYDPENRLKFYLKDKL